MSRFFKTPFTLSTVAAIALVALIIGVLVARVFNPTTTRANANAPASGSRVDVIDGGGSIFPRTSPAQPWPSRRLPRTTAISQRRAKMSPAP